MHLHVCECVCMCVWCVHGCLCTCGSGGIGEYGLRVVVCAQCVCDVWYVCWWGMRNGMEVGVCGVECVCVCVCVCVLGVHGTFTEKMQSFLLMICWDNCFDYRKLNVCRYSFKHLQMPDSNHSTIFAVDSLLKLGNWSVEWSCGEAEVVDRMTGREWVFLNDMNK